MFAILQLLLCQYINQAQEMISKKNSNELKVAIKSPRSNLFKNEQKRQVRQNVQQLKNQKEKMAKIKIKYKNSNILTQVYKILRITHIHNFLNHIVINEETIRNPEHGESITKTAFYMKTITEVSIKSDYIQMAVRSNQNQSSVSYMIDRFNSFGDEYFHMIANSLQSIASFFLSNEAPSSIQNRNTPPSFQLTRQQLITNFMDSIKGKAYIVSIIPGNFVFSKELLIILGYNPQQFANNALRYRCMLEDLLYSDNYKIKLQRNIHFAQCYIKVLQGKMKMQELLKESEFTCIDYLKDINQNKIVARLKSFMPNPFIYCVIVEEIISSIEPVKTINKPQKEFISQYNEKEDEEKQRIMDLFQIDDNMVQQQAQVRCGYKNLPRRRRRKSECDYQY